MIGLTVYRVVGFGKCGVEVLIAGLGCRHWLLRDLGMRVYVYGPWVKRAIGG